MKPCEREVPLPLAVLLSPPAMAGSWACNARLPQTRFHFRSYQRTPIRLVAKSHFRNGGANLPVCRGAQQGAAHHFGNDFWQSLKTHHAQKRLGVLAPNERKERNERNLFVGSRKMTELSLPNPLSSALPGLNLDVGR